MPRKLDSLTPEQRDHALKFLELQRAGVSYDKYCRAHGMTRTALCQWVTLAKAELRQEELKCSGSTR